MGYISSMLLRQHLLNFALMWVVEIWHSAIGTSKEDADGLPMANQGSERGERGCSFRNGRDLIAHLNVTLSASCYSASRTF